MNCFSTVWSECVSPIITSFQDGSAFSEWKGLHRMDCAATLGHCSLLQEHLDSSTQGCTTLAADFACLNNHVDLCLWLFSKRNESCSAETLFYVSEKKQFDVVSWAQKSLMKKSLSELTESCFVLKIFLATSVN
mmetsp:Transcript_5096/g.7040  ORF Transcript_5096/g.7040 Transcript_5096/m.7040 type:complete len:134 (-) Transcript_5096:164-565(-)